MKLALTAALAASLALSAFTPTAALADDPIVVSSHQAAVTNFADSLARDVSAGLNGALRSHSSSTREVTGLTAVTFNIDSQGQVSNVAMAERSGNSLLDSVARRVIKRLDIDPATLPPSVSRVRAYMIVATDQDSHDSLARKARDIEVERLMASRESRTELVLTLTPRTRS
ncbi:TonB family protein [Novosphingobium kunmingense]|uniref:TonB family protein n=1 Tax=Novosphingobium kunmingense TaxID=1211806 RepID=A0A2N0HKT2_9SPHN|nr:TonB family protein [Novosphingobium kunmingense]PKB19542.1 TonB family protein [Novosphingobium kunmingense]